MNVTERILQSRAQDYISSGKTEETALDFPEISGLQDGEKPDDLMTLMHQRLLPKSRPKIRAQAGSGGVQWAGMLDGTALVPDRSDNAKKDQKMLADIMASMESSVDRILQDKLPKMKKVEGKNMYDRKILLIWPDWFFADADRVREVLLSRSVSKQDVDAILFSASSSSIEVVADPAGLFGS
jgi:hypothetical protein